MAECSEREEKPSSLDEPVSLKIYVENAGSHEMRKNCYNDLNSKNHESSIESIDGTKAGDLKTLTDAEFLHLLKEATTFNQPSQPESVLLKQLRKEVSAIPEPSSNVTYVANNSSRFVQKSSPDNYDLPDISYESNYTYPTSQRTRKQKHNKSDSKPSINLNALEKNPNRSQSLKDLSSDSVKSKQKSHKSQRTLSLSSEEAIALISDSFTSKTAKKSKSNSSKSEQNKTNRGSSKVPQSSESLITLEVDNANSKGPRSSNCESLPYQLLVNETAISLPSSRKNSSTSALDCPVEIEMEEIKSDKDTKSDKTLSSNKELKTKNGPQQSNSKFYVDYTNDVDATVAFPLKLISSVDEQTEGLSDQFKRQVFPMVPWPKPVQVQSFFSSLPMEGDSFGSRNDKQLQDINGNPFTRPSRPSNLASFVSTTLLDYNNTGLISEPKNRKNKRAKNAVNNVVLSEKIAGFRGTEDIDSLLEYINSSDKNKKSSVKSPPNQLLSNKNGMFHDQDKKKSINKDLKNCQKNLVDSEKKKLMRSNSLESIPHTEKGKALTYSYEAGDTPIESAPKGTSSLDDTVVKHLDINSNVETHLPYLNEKSNNSSSTEELGSQNVSYTFPEVSSFAADFYSTANVSSQTNEESGFHVVKKRHKRKQSKRSDGYRWRNAQIQRKSGIMLPLADSKCGKQDSRRKSTSSVPHSEHSSNDNSDADSVHSLPVVSSNLHTQTQTLPHTTPSSSSSTPQASYADIARMPISKLNSPAPCIISYSGQNSLKQQGGDLEKMENASPVPYNNRKILDPQESSKSFNKELSCATVEDKGSCHGPEIIVQTHVKSTREINTQTEPQGSDTDSLRIMKTDTGHVCHNCLLSQIECSCAKHSCSIRRKTKSADIPPVIMDNMPSETDSCNVSFGFGIEEVLQMTPIKSLSPCPKKIYNEDSGYVNKCDFKNIESKDKPSALSEVSNASNDSYSKCSLSADVSQTVLSHDLPKEKSSQLRKVTYGSSGKNLVYCETEINTDKFNISELANFVDCGFRTIEEELKAFKEGKSNKRVVYYKCTEDTVPSKPH